MNNQTNTPQKTNPTLLIIGMAGSGKTTLFNRLTRGNGEVSSNYKDASHNCSVKLSKNGLYYVVDTPGYGELNSTTWWNLITQYSNVFHVIIMFNTSVYRTSQFGKFINIIDSIRLIAPHTLLGILGRNWTDPNYNYKTLLKKGSTSYDRNHISVKTLREHIMLDIDRPSVTILSTGQILNNYQQLKEENEMLKQVNDEFRKQVEIQGLNIAELNDKLGHFRGVNEELKIRNKDLEMKNMELNREVKLLEEKIRDQRDYIIKLQSEVNLLEKQLDSLTEKFKDEREKLKSLKSNFNNRLSILLDIDDARNFKSKCPGIKNHLYSWLPLAGNYHLVQFSKYCDVVYRESLNSKRDIEDVLSVLEIID